MSKTLPKMIANASIRLGKRAPFFQVLTLHTEWHEAPEIGTAATDGETIIYNPEFVASLSPAHLEAWWLMRSPIWRCDTVHAAEIVILNDGISRPTS